jgi:hypothetical protein
MTVPSHHANDLMLTPLCRTNLQTNKSLNSKKPFLSLTRYADVEQRTNTQDGDGQITVKELGTGMSHVR